MFLTNLKNVKKGFSENILYGFSKLLSSQYLLSKAIFRANCIYIIYFN